MLALSMAIAGLCVWGGGGVMLSIGTRQGSCALERLWCQAASGRCLGTDTVQKQEKFEENGAKEIKSPARHSGIPPTPYHSAHSGSL